MKAIVLGVSLAAALAASAADFTWLGKTANWKDALGWKNGNTGEEADWLDGQATIFPADAPIKDVVVDGDVTPGSLRIDGSYSFSGPGHLTVGGAFSVGAGATATFDGVSMSMTGSPVNGGAGTLELQGGATTMSRLSKTDKGDLVFNGGEHVVTASSTSAGSGAITVHLNDGHMAIEGGARVTVAAANTYGDNSGAVVEVNDGVFDVYKVGEFLHGFGDNYASSTSSKSSFTVRDKGTMIAKCFRLGKVQRATFNAYNQQYARTTLETGGVFVVHNFAMDSVNQRNDYCARLDFNGGTLVITNENSTRFTVSTGGGNWSNVVMSVKEGGARFRMDRKDCYADFQHDLTSGAEKDGGLTVSGVGFFYFGHPNWPSTYNGGVHLTGAGDICLIPSGHDGSFGAVPAEPTPNVFFESSGPILHFGESWATHPNRTFVIGTNQTAKIGVIGTKTARVTGVITGHAVSGSPSASRLWMLSNWPGCLEIGPEDGRTNTIGMVRVSGHLRHVAGTTLVTSNAPGKITDSAPLYVCGNGKSYNDAVGVLAVAGGTFKVTRSVWCDVSSYAQVIVTNGHFDVSATAEYLNGLNSPARTIVGGNGLMTCNQFRISQTSALLDGEPAAQVRLLKGGTLKLNKFWIDPAGFRYGTLLLDGGTLAARANTENFIGEDDAKGYWHTGIYVRAGANGAVVDTAGHTVRIKNPILSGAEADGGFTKKGEGTLTLNSTNSYNGVTRVDAGTLVFAHADGYPGGGIEISAAALKDSPRAAELINAVSIAFRAGAKIRVVEVDGVDPRAFGKRVVVAKALNPIASLPPVVLVDKDGNERDAGSDWRVSLSADGRTLSFGPASGMAIVVR